MKKIGIFLDTGFYIGLLNPKDNHYSRCLELLKEVKTGRFGAIYTSIFIMAEAATLIGIRSRNNSIIIRGLFDHFNGRYKIVLLFRPTKEIEDQTWEFYFKVNGDPSKKFISFVDCSNVKFCKNHSIDTILSFDTHFDSWLTRLS